MKISRASFLGAVLVAMAVVAAGCAASDGDNQAPDAGPSIDFAALDATTAASTEVSPHTVAPELATDSIGETAPSPSARTPEATREPTPSSISDTGAQPVAGQDGPLLQSTRDVEVDLSKYRALLSRDAIFPIYEPVFISPGETDLDPEELVMGLEINGDSRAYPIGTLNRREMVNDVVGGVPVLVTW